MRVLLALLLIAGGSHAGSNTDCGGHNSSSVDAAGLPALISELEALLAEPTTISRLHPGHRRASLMALEVCRRFAAWAACDAADGLGALAQVARIRPAWRTWAAGLPSREAEDAAAVARRTLSSVRRAIASPGGARGWIGATDEGGGWSLRDAHVDEGFYRGPSGEITFGNGFNKVVNIFEGAGSWVLAQSAADDEATAADRIVRTRSAQLDTLRALGSNLVTCHFNPEV